MSNHFSFISDGLRHILRDEGLGALWSGTGPSVVLAGNPAVQFTIYESLKRFMMQNGKVYCFLIIIQQQIFEPYFY